ncbi:hypothetical protein CAPTEDRAFT_187528 [Capitella teleta]|uniref:Uncharacterized protein n=1 Tax=Capitella teleta TaxID=283909 RepID=R7TNI7_CAPTE|nr:hypothetical protein CAPTEDRAFT_187528 [Capitella teleta]|eukprot:ELT95199.1 hypothetical protein CAPTEDRAFT_187528 [Capitella teleta]
MDAFFAQPVDRLDALVLRVGAQLQTLEHLAERHIPFCELKTFSETPRGRLRLWPLIDKVFFCAAAATGEESENHFQRWLTRTLHHHSVHHQRAFTCSDDSDSEEEDAEFHEDKLFVLLMEIHTEKNHFDSLIREMYKDIEDSPAFCDLWEEITGIPINGLAVCSFRDEIRGHLEDKKIHQIGRRISFLQQLEKKLALTPVFPREYICDVFTILLLRLI